MNKDVRLVGLGGYAESGKDAFADILVKEFGWKKDYMSRPLEQALLTLNPLVPHLNCFIPACNLKTESYSMLHKRVGYTRSKEIPEVRRLLQVLGTDIGRNMFGQYVWVDLMEKRLKIALDNFEYKMAVTGIRFHNELDMIHRQDGVVIWMDRGGSPVNVHSSDNTLKSEDFDVVVNNRGSLEDLQDWIKAHFHDSP